MMKKLFKKVVSLILAVLLLAGFSHYLFIIDTGAVLQRWIGILSIDLNMAFNGSNGRVDGIASKQSAASLIEGTVYLYKLVGNSWVYENEWYNSKTRGTLAVGGNFVCESGTTYKAVFVVTAYTESASETETVEYTKRCP